jgi:hypothetical protein
MRVVLLIFVPIILPAVIYVIWRTFAPPKIGGSEAIAKDQWEPLPWRWLLGSGVTLMAFTLAIVILFPDVFGGL